MNRNRIHSIVCWLIIWACMTLSCLFATALLAHILEVL